MPRVWADNLGSGGGGYSPPIPQSDVTNLVSDIGSKVSKAGDTMTGALLLPSGSVSAAALARALQPNTGVYFGASQVSTAVAGTEKFRVTATEIRALQKATVLGLQLGRSNIGASYSLDDSTSNALLVVTQATSEIYLPLRNSWNSSICSGPYYIFDPLNQLSSLKIYPWDSYDGVTWNDINGTIWYDGLTPSTGPDGAYAEATTAGGLWVIFGNTRDTGSGAAGGWTIQRYDMAGLTI